MSPVVQIQRVRGLTREQFETDYARGAGTPLVITDATERWAARTKWTFAFLKAAYGHDLVCPELGLDSGIGKTTRLATYIDYLDTPDGELPGFWTNVATARPLETTDGLPDVRPYLVDWNAFRQHPELYDDITPPLYFTSDWTSALTRNIRHTCERIMRRNYSDVLVGPAGSLSALHFDYGHTHSCLSQIRGTKRALLFAPGDSAFLYDGRVDPEAPDLQRFELFSRATAYEAVLQPGDVLFTPPGWWHHVRALEASITVSHNFFNRINCIAHVRDLAKKLRRRRGE